MPHLDIDLLTEPQTGQRTKAQSPAHSSNLQLPGFGMPLTSTYSLYREIRSEPTVSIGYAAATAPIIASNWRYIAKKGAPAGALEFIEETLEPLRPWFTEQALWGIQFGFQPFEKIWDVVDGKFTIIKMKPLLQDKTTILVNEQTGGFMGLLADNENSIFTSNKQKGTFLPPEKSFIYTHNHNPYDGLYGRSRFENFKADWQAAQTARSKQGQFMDKVSSVLFVLEYMEGKSTDRFGAEIDNSEAAKILIDSLRSGMAVAVPNTLSPKSEDLIEMGIDDPKLLKSFNLELLETATGHQAEFVTTRQDLDRRILRGMLVPENVVLQGSGGDATKESANIGVLMAEQTMRELIRQVNWYMVNQLMALNFGMDAVGTVEIQPEPLSTEKRFLLKELVRMLFSPQNSQLTLSLLDVDKLLSDIGVPTASGGMVQNNAEIMDSKENNQNNENPQEGEPGEPRTNRQSTDQETDRGSNIE